jgi:hypothetical protein
MKINKKMVGLGVAVVVALAVLWSVFKPAPAEAKDVGFTIGAERKVDAQTNAMYLDTEWGSILGLDVVTGVNYTVDDDADASFDSFELDASKSISENLTIYANNDFDVDLDHTETTVGFKYKF